MIILKKSEHVEEVLRGRDLGDKPTATLYDIAGYYFKNGLNKAQVKKKLEEFLRQALPGRNINSWNGTIDYVIKRAKKCPIVDVESIKITVNEIEVIKSMDGVMLQKLAFTLLCLAKYANICNPKQDSWVTNDDTEIFKMANITANLRKQSALYNKLFSTGYVKFSKKIDNTSIQITYLDEDPEAEIALEITDMRNLGYQYLMHTGGPYFVCECCGITTRINNPKSKKPQRYCSCCANQIAMKQRIDSVMRSRA